MTEPEEAYGVIEQPAVKLPDLDDHEDILGIIMSELGDGWKRLRQEYRDAMGHDVSAVHRKVLRFRDETLAGLMAGPHVPLADADLATSVRESAAEIRRQVDDLLANRVT